MPRLLVVHHSPSASLQQLLERVVAGAHAPELAALAGPDGPEGQGVLEVVVRAALEATAEDVLAADGYLLGTSANFGYMSGALKHFFDSTFLAVGGALGDDGSPASAAVAGTTARRPYGLWVHGRFDLTGAVRSVTAITGALGWRPAAPVLEVLGPVQPAHREAAYDLGATLGAVLLA